MAAKPIQQQIVEKFLARLSATEKFDAVKLELLRKQMTSGNKIKVDDLVQVLSMPGGSDLK